MQGVNQVKLWVREKDNTANKIQLSPRVESITTSRKMCRYVLEVRSLVFDWTRVTDRKEFLMSRRVTLFIDGERRSITFYP